MRPSARSIRCRRPGSRARHPSQLAQTLPSGRLLVVFSVYTETQHEYEAVVVDSSGALVEQFSLPAAEWAQSMPLSRFRLVGSSLYELGSTEAGVFVDRYDLGV